jgi:hypothetical protein
MKQILNYLKTYLSAVDKRILILSTIFISLAIYINYHYGLNNAIRRLPHLYQYICWYLVFFIAFGFGYLLFSIFLGNKIFTNKKFLALFLIAPAIFSWKMVFNLHVHITPDRFANEYWNDVLYWPFKIAGVVLMLFFVKTFLDKRKNFYGLTTKDFTMQPYFIMLLIMVPLIAAASTQHDFLGTYPRFQRVDYLLQPYRGREKLLYELSYGSDFFTIELFFRGFLILAFMQYAGKDCILPMALFYCTIHFGKPLGECISSYFGGIILGVVIYNTRTIYGGLIVHLGIAWLMELGGYLGNLAFHS